MRTRRWVFALLAASVITAAPWPRARAQQVSGRVVLPNGENPIPVPGAWVVLHRVGHDSAGPLDSMRTNARGEYTFRYPRTEEDSALYLVSSLRGGVAYFSPPIRPGNIRGQAAEVMVFDTSSAKLPLHVQGRHFVVATGRDGSENHEILEVYELSNDTTLTAVAPQGGGGVWNAIIPEGAKNFRIGQGDVSEGGLVLRNGRVELLAPIAPGLKQISFRYELPRSTFPLRLPITEDVGVLEIVADDPAARVTGAGLREVPAMASEGRTFKRFLAQDVHENAVVRVELGARGALSRGATIALLGALFAAGAAGALALAMRRGRARPSLAATRVPVPATASESEVLIRAIAELDARFERRSAEQAAENGDERASYQAERSALKEQLRAALARGPQRA
jgi:hypothetical protein